MSSLAWIVLNWIDNDWSLYLQTMEKPRINFFSKKKVHQKIEMAPSLDENLWNQ